MDVILTAGGVPLPGQPLFEITQGAPKAMLEIRGKPMIQWVLDALAQAEKADDVYVVGLNQAASLSFPRPVTFLPDHGNMVANIVAGAQAIRAKKPGTTHAILAASDVPAVTPAMIDWMVTTCQATDDDIYYNVIEQATMEKKYPSSRRSYLKLKDVTVCGGDVNVFRLSVVDKNLDMWEKLIGARKSVRHQAAILGLGTLFRVLTRSMTLSQAVTRISHRLKIKGRAILCPYAEIGMDVDKGFQLEILRSDLALRSDV